MDVESVCRAIRETVGGGGLRRRRGVALLTSAGWLPPELGGRLEEMAGFRNVLVHEYAIVDLAVVRDVLENRLGDLLELCRALRRRLPPPPAG